MGKQFTIDDAKPGTVVRLRSGGPAMTISEVLGTSLRHETPRVRCHWVDESGGRECAFPIVVLMKH
jgi:uncharacterized protein YodC (DUF2158 family)